MTPKRTPLVLYAWLLVTFLFSSAVAVLSKYFHRRMGAEPNRFPERLGKYGSQCQQEVIWFHAASLGEVMQIGPLAEHLARTERGNILVTTTTATGADYVAQKMPFARHRFVPIDTPAAVRGFLDAWDISAGIFIEGDLWPRMVKEMRNRDVPQILLNARNSRTRARLPALFASLLASFSLVTCRSEAVADDMLRLGLRPDRVHVLPDLRLTLPRPTADPALIEQLSRSLGHRVLWLAASTHPADEQAVLSAHQEVIQDFPEALLILAPRHPRRGNPLRKMVRDKGYTVAQRSLNESISDTTQVYIADTLGELGTFFSLCPIAFLGGSFGTEGGHNPYEPASFGTALIYGPNVKNFVDAYTALAKSGAATQIQDPAQFGAAVVELMEQDRAETMAQAGLVFMEERQDCLSTYVDLTKAVLDDSKAKREMDRRCP